MPDYSNLAKRLGYSFKNPELVEQAFTHRSFSSGHNERLEFLGDSILGLIISEELFGRFPDASEGQLSRLRAQLVKGETLGELAAELRLGEFLKLGAGELKSGGRRRQSILANTYEALLGALFLDGGLGGVKPIVLTNFSRRLDECDPETLSKDPKTRLQEFLQGRGYALPVYEVTEISGKGHNQNFAVLCSLDSELEKFSAEGVGGSRRKAEQAAAENTLCLIEQAGK